jgi:lauroyl/myristoyl acyltransferase
VTAVRDDAARGQLVGDPPAVLRRGLIVATAALHGLGPLRRPLAAGIGLAAWAVDVPHRRRAVANHLRLGAVSEAQARSRARGSFREYARTNVDFIWATRLDAAQVAVQSRLVGREHIDAATRGGKGAVLALSHFGNWDFAAWIAWSIGLRLTTVMAPVGNPAITRLVVWARQRSDMEVFTPDGAARGLLRAMRRGRFVALLSDVVAGGPRTTLQYCGGPVEFSLVPAWLAMRTGAPLLPVDCRRGGRGEPPYVLTVHEPVVAAAGEDEAAVMQRVATVLESAVRAHPEQWYPFGSVYAD